MAKAKTGPPRDEHRALLPPGLPNHGNTCFMNSVLQALIAARPARRLLRDPPRPPPRTPPAPAPAPVLAIADREHGLPVAHRLVALLRTAWDIQDSCARDTVSPKDLLAALGSKYDQYLDFCQQDAHEFLCHLLDAIRMEEADLIKHRSELSSAVDILFGGKLASILVCQACKHVSHTYEDFTDLSLSMRPEDYVRARKRDKLKQFAKKIGTAFYVAAPQPRSSSVPATPVRASNPDSIEHTDTQRRRSVDLADVSVPDPSAPSAAPSPSPSLPGTPIDTVPAPPPQEHPLPEKAASKERKDESWTRISKRIGLAMRPKDKKSDATASPTAADTVGEPAALGTVNEKLQAQLTNVKRPVKSSSSPLGTSTPRFPLISRPSSPGTHSRSSKPPRPPKLGAEEAAYLRVILADINPPNIQKPFSIFKDPSSSAQSIFLKLNQINRIEECLRLFTSVEVLDGDNTVRCHRCWKIANGFYQQRARACAEDSCTDSDDDEPVRPTLSHSTASFQDTQLTTHDTQTTLTQHSSRTSSVHNRVPPALQLNDSYPIELVSPVRDLAAPSVSAPSPPETAIPARTARPIGGSTLSSRNVSSSHVSLSIDPHKFRNVDTESEISEGESETLLSVYSDVSSVVSTTSPHASQEHLEQQLLPPQAKTKKEAHPSGVPRSRQFILRPAYKRYLIATPPPILVIHLKRFRQLSKTPVVSFSTGFKKLDDYISFPEHLDLGPYLAPKREEYFGSKVAVMRGRAKRPTPCMYRLYAVVVHIGNILGGHYVAYTALPPTPGPLEASDVEGEKARTDSRDWAFISDTHVRPASLEEVLKSKAYLCMYERI